MVVALESAWFSACILVRGAQLRLVPLASLACDHIYGSLLSTYCVGLQSGSYEFSNARSAMVSPLAKRLFRVDGISGKCHCSSTKLQAC